MNSTMNRGYKSNFDGGWYLFKHLTRHRYIWPLTTVCLSASSLLYCLSA